MSRLLRSPALFPILFLICATLPIPAQISQSERQSSNAAADTDVSGIGPIIKVNGEINHARTIAVRDMPTIDSLGGHVSREAEPARRIPLPAGVDIPNFEDPVLQHSTAGLAPTLAAPTAAGVNIDGLGNASLGFTVNSAPPDTNGAVGATQYVQWVNSSFAVFNKTTGALVSGPIAGNTLFSALGNGCATNNDGDPVALYDKLAGRWVLSQFSVSTRPFLQCIAVSTTSDATGAYNVYSFPYSNFDDYPKMGVWPDAYYETFNMFNGNIFVGADACAYDRSRMLTGAAATQVCFQQGSGVGGLLPADLDGTTPPPAGEPNFMLFFGANNLNLFKFHVDFTTPSASTFTGPTVIPVAAFSALCGGRTCVPQAGTTTQLDSLADRLMFRLAYRNLGTREALVVSHSVVAGAGGGIRWYEIDNPSGTPVVAQQSTFAPDAKFRWMGSIAMDHNGNMGLGYSVSSSTSNPSIAVTGRLATDPANTMQAETTVITGTGSQTGTLTRWGDYSAMTVDPVDDCTFWFTSEYMKTTGSFNWNTRIANFRFAGCATPDFSLVASPAGLTITQTGSGNSTISVTPVNGFTGSVTLSASGLPLGVTPVFSTNPTSGTSVITFTAGSTATTGPATVTITGTSGSLTHTATISLTVNPAPNASLTPAGLTFAPQIVGTVSPAGTLTLRNITAGPLSNIMVGASSEFTQTNDCGSSLAGNASCTITVKFAPAATGLRPGTITVTDDAANSPQTAVLTGTAIPASLGFAPQVVGTTSPAQTFTLNNGPVALSNLSITAAGGEFVPTSDCGISLPANASCTVSVTFTPGAAGTRFGSLIVADNAANSPQVMILTGTAIPGNLGFAPQVAGTTSPAQTFTLSAGPVALSGLSITAASSGNEFVQTNNCGTSLAANTSCTVTVTFTPGAVGTRTGALNIADSAANSPQIVALNGTAIPGSLGFPPQVVGTTSPAQTFTLSSGAVALSNLAIATTSPGNEFIQTNNCGISLAANTSCTISVTFTPGAAGTRAGTLNIADSAPNSPQIVSLTGTAISGGLGFAPQVVGTTSPVQTITLSNGPTLLTNLVISSAGTEFAQTSDCGTSLAPGASCTISIKFTPSVAGTRTGVLTIADNAPNSPQSIALTGAALPGALGFASQLVGTTGTAQTITLSNPGPGTLLNIGVSITAGNTEFTQTSTCGSTLPANGACTISVTFTPASAGSRSGTLTITDSAANSPQTVSLSGTGLLPPRLTSISPSTVTAGSGNFTLVLNGSFFARGAVMRVNGIARPTTIVDTTQLRAAMTSADVANIGSLSITVVNPPPTNVETSPLQLTIVSAPIPLIGSLAPSRVVVGNPSFKLIVNGSFFPGDSVVQIGGSPRVTRFISPSQLTATILDTDLLSSGPPPQITVTSATGGVSANGEKLAIFRYGDLGFDNVISVLDLTFLANILAGNSDPIDRAPGDLNLDGVTNVLDLSILANYLAGNIHTLPVFDAPVLFNAGATVSLSPPTFAGQALNTTSDPLPVRLVNGGAAAVSSINISAQGDFSQSNDCPPSLPVNAFCTINLTFTPTLAGGRTGTLMVTDSAGNSPQTATLTGTGIANAVPPTATLSASGAVTDGPATLQFASQAVGTDSIPQVLTLTNQGPTPLSISGIGISPGNEFAQSNNCGSSLAANASCTITVTFSPAAAGARTATLAVTDNAGNSPQTANLSGTGGGLGGGGVTDGPLPPPLIDN